MRNLVSNMNMKKKLFLLCSTIIGAFSILLVSIFSSYIVLRNDIGDIAVNDITLMEKSFAPYDDLMYYLSNVNHLMLLYTANDGNSNEEIEQLKTYIEGNFLTAKNNLEEAKKVYIEKLNTNSEEIQLLENFATIYDGYTNISPTIYRHMENGEVHKALIIFEEHNDIASDFSWDVFNNYSSKFDTLTNNTINVHSKINKIIPYMIIGILIIYIFALLMSNRISSYITKDVLKIKGYVMKLANGKLDKIERINQKDEIGNLSTSLQLASKNITSLINEISNTIDDYTVEGKLLPKINSHNFKGSYKVLAEGINKIFEESAKSIAHINESYTELSKGNFNVAIEKEAGEKVIISDTYEMLRENLHNVANTMAYLSEQGVIGNLEVSKTDMELEMEGEWLQIVDTIHLLFKNIADPIKETNYTLGKVAEGDLQVSILGEYQGTFEDMKENVNVTVLQLRKYIDEIKYSLNEVSKKNLNSAISMEFKGEFNEIKSSINEICKSLSDVFEESLVIANEVTQLSNTVSKGSNIIADGSTKQVAIVEELSSSTRTISEKIIKNSKNAEEALKKSQYSKEAANKGNDEMQLALSAMEEIEETSNSISSIIKVIDEIAFQTNLLALNAATEAARAGTHGKGFAVVAEEVRALAEKSKNAAKKTENLINTSMQKVSIGNDVVSRTAEKLNEIVVITTEVSEVLNGIVTSSSEQVTSVEEILTNLDKFESFAQENTLSSEKGAESAQLLLEKSKTLRNFISKFNLIN